MSGEVLNGRVPWLRLIDGSRGAQDKAAHWAPSQVELTASRQSYLATPIQHIGRTLLLAKYLPRLILRTDVGDSSPDRHRGQHQPHFVARHLLCLPPKALFRFHHLSDDPHLFYWLPHCRCLGEPSAWYVNPRSNETVSFTARISLE